MNITIPEQDFTRVGECEISLSDLESYCSSSEMGYLVAFAVLFFGNIGMYHLVKRDKADLLDFLMLNMIGLIVLGGRLLLI